MSLQDRRNYPRVDKKLHVIISAPTPRPDGTFSSKTFAAMTANVSLGGVKLRLRQSLTPGAPIRITLAWDRPSVAFDLTGRILRVIPLAVEGMYECAVSFEHQDDARRQRWEVFCTESLGVELKD